jgi:hypothetical protein
MPRGTLLPPVNLEFEQCLLRAILKGARCPDFLGAQHSWAPSTSPTRSTA